jgi:EAL domain-containing protein (putative c-di-GMP-specific phosphodiesterase class I)
VKIDRSFVGRMSGDQQGADLVRAIVALAHNLGMDVVAEGVETEAQLAQLEAIGCEYAQGFFFSKPVDAVTAEALIDAEPWRVHGTRALAHG